MVVYKEISLTKEPKKRTCKKCKSELGIEESDIIKYEEFDQREGKYFVDGFKCPICNTEQPLYLFYKN